MNESSMKWWIGAVVVPVLILVASFVATGWMSEKRRQQPLDAGPAPWNTEKEAHDIPLDNNSTTIRRGYRATFQAKQVPYAPTAELVLVDKIVFTPRDQIGDFTWQKPIGNISLPANSSAMINAYVVDAKLAGTLLEGDLTIEFAAEEKLQPVRYPLYLTVLKSVTEVPQ